MTNTNGDTVKKEVRVFKTSKLCVVKDCDGELIATGLVITIPQGIASLVATTAYEHKCNKCGVVRNYSGVKYPIYSMEEISE